jgi:hypothetical protein
MEGADPFEGEGAKGGLMTHAASATRLVEGLCPEGAWNGLADPFDECLAQKRRTSRQMSGLQRTWAAETLCGFV